MAGNTPLLNVLLSMSVTMWGSVFAYAEERPADEMPVDHAEEISSDDSQAGEPALREMVSSGPYCGIYSLQACLNALAISVDPKDLVSPDYIGSSEGSSGAELLEAVKACGAHARGFTQFGTAELKRAGGPMILHLRSNWQDRGYNHWVAFLGVDGDRVRILDLPHSIELVSFAEVLAKWDGMALAVSDSPIDYTILHEARLDFVIRVTVLLSLVYVLRRLFQNRWPESRDLDRRKRLPRLGTQMAVLLGLAGVFGIGYHALSETGFLKNPSAVADVTRRYCSVNVPERSLAEMSLLIDQGDSVIIDARRAVDFRHGAIPGAINVPVDSSLAERRQALINVTRSSPIIVYCQSAGCRYADEVVTFLRFNDYTNLTLFRGGYREWANQSVSHLTETSPKGTPSGTTSGEIE
ncbi:MAG: hypothetical protein GY832_28315 [Chloroflexi bacterium]|nr:hypothetical protein [Chloroflexota bacterium]